MKSYRIENIRSIRDSGIIEIKPLNIFIGTNSSGKSTALRIFPLLKQSSERSLSSPFLLNGHLVDFGDIDEFITKENGKLNNQFKLSFEFMLNSSIIDVQLFISNILGSTFLSKCTIECENTINTYVFDGNGKCKILVNDEVIIKSLKEKAVQNFCLPEFGGDRDFGFYMLRMLFDITFKFIKDIKYKANENELLNYIINSDNKVEILYPEDLKSFIVKKDPKIAIDDRMMQVLNTFSKLKNSLVLYSRVDTYLKNFAKGIQYFDPLRARSQRYYRKEDLSFDSMDSRGENIYIIIKNMVKNNSITEFNKWTSGNFGFSIDIEEIKGHTSIRITDSKTGPINIIDCGFGYSQILPIIITMWEKVIHHKRQEPITPTMIAIEQPELHLHPSMQGKITDLLATCASIAKENNISIPIILETHSTVVINKVGSMICDKKISKDDVCVYLFDRNQSGNTVVSKTIYNEYGDIEEWPYGFMSAEF